MPSHNEKCVHVMHVVRKGGAGGGMENGIVNVTNHLPAGRFRVSVCALDTFENFSEKIERPGTGYYLLPPRYRGADWSWIKRLSRLFREAQVDIVHSHSWGTFPFSIPAAKWAGLKTVHGEHGKNFDELGEVNHAKNWTKSILGRGVDRLVTVSAALRLEWIGEYRMPETKVINIPNGVDTRRFAPAAQPRASYRRRFGLPEDAYIVGSVGRLDPIKNFSLLLRAARHLAGMVGPLAIALLGDGICRPQLEREAQELGIAEFVHFLGERKDVDQFLPALDAFVLPSGSEGMSNVVLEAMAAGLPVICRDLPSHRQLIDSGQDGLLLNPCSAEILAETLAGLSRGAQRRAELGHSARAKVESRFSLENMVAAYQRLYLELGG